MTQLIIGGVELPEAKNGKYKCYEKELGENIRMISGRMVTEVRSSVKVIEYAYDFMGNDLMRALLAALRSRGDLTVQFLDPTSDALQESTFRCTKQPAPQFAFTKNGAGLWHNVAFTLEEVKQSKG